MSSFVDLTLPERERFLKETAESHIPGYTGHCPTLKFRFGKRYGANTRDIINQLKQIPPVNYSRPLEEKNSWSNTFRKTIREQGEELDPVIYTELPRRPFILGYTGFIPGLNFEYGLPFSNAANKSILKFTRRLADWERKRQENRMQFIHSQPNMYSVRNKDEVSRLIDKNSQHFYKNRVPPVAPELPPIAGYTGHIPRVKGNDASLSQRYYSAAKSGLATLREERNRRHHLDLAKEAVAEAVAYSHS